MISYWNIVYVDRTNDSELISNGLIKFSTAFPREKYLKRLFKNKEIVYMRKVSSNIPIPEMLK